MSILPPGLFLHSFPHNWVRKCLDFLPLIGELPYIYFTVGKALCMDVCYLFIFYIHHFSLNRTDVAAKQRFVTQNQWQDEVRKYWCCLKETCSGVMTIFQTVQRYALSLVRNVNSI